MSSDREIAYEQNVTALERVWEERIESFARTAIDANRTDYRDDVDGLQLAATEAVTQRLLDSVRWESVEAADISDIAYEAVSRVLDSGE